MHPARDSDPDKPILVLLRNDLRVRDNGALSAAAESGKPMVVVFILDEESDGVRPLGAARRWWLHLSLLAFAKSIASLGCELVLRRGKTGAVVDALIEETGADEIVWNRRYVPAEVVVDKALKADLGERGLLARSFDGHLLHEPSVLRTGSGGPYKVYSPFWRALEALPDPRPPAKAPAQLKPFGKRLKGLSLDDLLPLPRRPDWAGGLRERWTPGEEAAHARLKDFLAHDLEGYGESRDFPGRDVTSRLSPHLAQGEITPFQIFAASRRESVKAPEADTGKFRKEVGWREFSYHLLFHHPDLAEKPFNPAFEAFEWRTDQASLAAWKQGRTGYPIVDAGMRELWTTGWMHNRVRMVVASFLIKHLMVDWREGERWFWDTLVDADPANNAASWQWVAGSGADAAPYFRVFNPILQGEKFDADGAYVRRWVPELTRLPDRYLHAPWIASEAVLGQAGVKLGTTYPVTIVNHDQARDRALEAYKSMRGN